MRRKHIIFNEDENQETTMNITGEALSSVTQDLRLTLVKLEEYSPIEMNFSSFALLIDGKINKYEKGNAAMRTLIGFGAGSSKFNAIVNIKDSQTKKSLGRIDVSKMSWLLGGLAAGSQDVESHMDSAASKIADECAKSNIFLWVKP